MTSAPEGEGSEIWMKQDRLLEFVVQGCAKKVPAKFSEESCVEADAAEAA